MAPGVVGGGALCRVPTWLERAKNNPVLNGLSENVSFDSELALAFEIQAFKVVLYVFLF